LDAALPPRRAEERRRRLQGALTLAIGRAPGYHEAVVAVLRQVCKTFVGPWDMAEAWLTSREGSILKPGPAWTATQKAFLEFRARSRKLGFRRGHGLPGRVLETAEPEWIEDVTQGRSGYFRRQAAREAGLRAALAVPVRTPQDVHAVLVFYATRARPPDRSAMRTLAAVLGSVGPLLEARKIEEELRDRARQQEAVAKLGVQALAKTARMEDVMRTAVDVVARDLGVEYAEVLEASASTPALVLKAGIGWGRGRVGRTAVPLGPKSHAGYALRSHAPLVIEDFDRETRFAVPVYVAERDLASGVSVIIHGHEQPLGVLGVYTTRRRRFTGNDIHFLQGVANVLGNAIERTRAAEALREREGRIRAIVDTAVDGILTIDDAGTIRTFNPAAERLFGYRADEAIGHHVGLLIPAEQRGLGLFDYFREGKRPTTADGLGLEGRRKNGSRFPMHLSVARLQLGHRAGFVGMVHDLTRQKAVERALEKERAFVSNVLDAAGALVAVLDGAGRVLRFNRAAESTTGLKFADVEGRPLWELLPSLDARRAVRGAFGEVSRGGAPCECECECAPPDGARRLVHWHFTALRNAAGEVEHVVAAGIDVTARRQAEEELERHRQHLEKLVEERTAKLEAYHEQLRQADRLASIGTFAAGLGHDMHNVLLPVLCRLDALEQASLPPATRAEVQGIRQSLNFLRQLSRGLRLFALDPDDPDASGETTNLNEWWAQVSPLLTRTLPRDVSFDVDIPGGLAPVRVPGHRLTQAVLNLVVNAGEATGGEGRVRLWAEASDDGRTVRLRVSDDGHGMSSEVQRHALEPFFTTKKRDLSTGLGLSLVHGVAKTAGGSVTFDSTPGEGTTVLLELPTTAAPRGRAPRRRGKERARTASVSLANGRTAAIVTTLLRSAGFEVGHTPPDEPGETVLWITETDRSGMRIVRHYLAADLDRRVIVLGKHEGAESRPRLTFVEGGADLEASSELESLRQALRQAVHDLVETTDVF